MRRIRIDPKIILGIFVAIIICIILAYSFIINKHMKKNNYVKDVMELAAKNENNIFTLEKIYLCSSANVIDNSIAQNLQDLSIYQYADIALHINNKNYKEDITNENTIKELYIDNISLEGSSGIGEKSLIYTNSLDLGKNTDVQNIVNSDRIDFDIIYTNNDNQNRDYSKPTFYTDCSNPITLKYVNKNIVTGYKMEKDSSISFNGKLLKKAGVNIEDIKCNLSFKINLVNNDDQHFSCWMNFDIPLNELYEKGVIIRTAHTQGTQYDFFCH